MVLALVAPQVVAQHSPALSYGLETAVRSGHSDRGFLISDRAVFQPVVWASWRGAESYLWSNLALVDATDGTRPGIVEAGLSQAYEWKGFSLTPEARMYFYRDPVLRSSSRSFEAWLNLTRDLGPLTLFTRHSLDLMDYRGGYFGEAGLEASGNVLPSLEIGGSFSGGWANARFNEYWAGVATSTFNRISAESWFNIYLRPHVYIGPHLEFSSIVDRDVRAGDLFSPSYFLFRLATGVEFP